MNEERISVAVFGSSEPRDGEPAYAVARQVGRLLGGAGYTVVTGGYGGVMEAANRGAQEGGGTSVGVTCRLFSSRAPNPFLDVAHPTEDLFLRTRELVRLARGFLVLPGKSGTLAELTFLWALHRAGALSRQPVILVGGTWRPLLRYLVQAGILETPQFDVTRVVDTPEEALDQLSRFALEDARG